MEQTSATAPGKIILFGEHSVVYGRPAIAVPVTQVKATAIVEDSKTPGVRLHAPDLGRYYWLREAGEEDPFARAVQLFAATGGHSPLSGLTITIRSTIPIASGLGSGAAMAAAVIRALARHLGPNELASDEQVSCLTYQVELLLHGTPSGIDNTVVAYEQPVFFKKQQPQNLIELLSTRASYLFLVADTGITSATKAVVADVRTQWLDNPEIFERLFDSCGRVAELARQCIENGEQKRLGQLMWQNHSYLREMTVSNEKLDKLVAAAKRAGAYGAKLSGAGRGGNMIALVDATTETAVRQSLQDAGAISVLTSVLDNQHSTPSQPRVHRAFDDQSELS